MYEWNIFHRVKWDCFERGILFIVESHSLQLEYSKSSSGTTSMVVHLRSCREDFHAVPTHVRSTPDKSFIWVLKMGERGSLKLSFLWNCILTWHSGHGDIPQPSRLVPNKNQYNKSGGESEQQPLCKDASLATVEILMNSKELTWQPVQSFLSSGFSASHTCFDILWKNFNLGAQIFG